MSRRSNKNYIFKTIYYDGINLTIIKLCFRLFWAIFYVAFIYYTPSLIMRTNENVIVPTYYYLILGFVCTEHEVSS